MKEDKSSHAYWKATLGLLTKILIVWFLVSFGAAAHGWGRGTSTSFR